MYFRVRMVVDPSDILRFFLLKKKETFDQMNLLEEMKQIAMLLVLLSFRFLLRVDHPMVLGKEVGELLEGRLGEHCLLPEVWGQIRVGLGDGRVGGLGEVAEGAGGSGGGGVAILDTSHLKQLLGNWRGNDSGTAGGWDQAHPDGTALTGHLGKNK